MLNRFAEPELVLAGPRGASLTNIAFGGPDRKLLYCTDSTHGTVLVAPMEVAGRELATAASRAG